MNLSLKKNRKRNEREKKGAQGMGLCCFLIILYLLSPSWAKLARTECYTKCAMLYARLQAPVVYYLMLAINALVGSALVVCYGPS